MDLGLHTGSAGGRRGAGSGQVGGQAGLSAPTYAVMQRALVADSHLKLLDQPEGAPGASRSSSDRAAALRTRSLVGQLSCALRRPGTQTAVCDLTARLCVGPGQLATIMAYAMYWVAAAGELPADRKQRRARWITAQLRPHDDTKWLPVSLVGL